MVQAQFLSDVDYNPQGDHQENWKKYEQSRLREEKNSKSHPKAERREKEGNAEKVGQITSQ